MRLDVRPGQVRYATQGGHSIHSLRSVFVYDYEERRLFYVGMTRAQEKLVLTHARKRFLFGQAMGNPLSRFVSDIESALKEVREAEVRRAA